MIITGSRGTTIAQHEYSIVNRKIGYEVYKTDNIESLLSEYKAFGHQGFMIVDENGNTIKKKDIQSILNKK